MTAVEGREQRRKRRWTLFEGERAKAEEGSEVVLMTDNEVGMGSTKVLAASGWCVMALKKQNWGKRGG